MVSDYKIILKKFHEMESSLNFFTNFNSIPVWDLIRYRAYRSLIYSKEAQLRLSNQINNKKPYHFIFNTISQFLLLMFKKSEIVFFIYSRYKNAEGFNFDMPTQQWRDHLNFKGISIEYNNKSVTKYNTIKDITSILFKLGLYKNINFFKEFEFFKNVFESNFQKSFISYEEFLNEVRIYKIQYNLYKFILGVLKTKYVFISVGNPKGLIYACRDLKISSVLFQHGVVEMDEIDLSYPCGFDFHTAQVPLYTYFVTYGDYWGKGINLPALKTVNVGNDFFNYDLVESDVIPEIDLLVVSTIVHGASLLDEVEILLVEQPNFKICVKLHSNEFHLLKSYKERFKHFSILFITDEFSSLELLRNTKAVFLIVSSVLYEALSLGKEIYILKKENYQKQLLLPHELNLIFVENAKELLFALNHKKNMINKRFNFYSRFNPDKVITILKDLKRK